MEKKDHSYIVNNESSYLVGDLTNGVIEHLGDNTYRFLHKGINHTIYLYESEDKSYTLKIAGKTFVVEAKDELDLLIDQLGFNTIAAQKLTSIKAPMPGLVIDTMVSIGDEIKKGDSLLILEAMKMENVIKAEGEGIVKSIEVKKGDKVDKGQVLIEL